eukprot:Amastigsp_a339592_42.p3 type:complete len:192 gc:universal Amastigsp_a339592_42:2123-1548(-)
MSAGGVSCSAYLIAIAQTSWMFWRRFWASMASSAASDDSTESFAKNGTRNSAPSALGLTVARTRMMSLMLTKFSSARFVSPIFSQSSAMRCLSYLESMSLPRMASAIAGAATRFISSSRVWSAASSSRSPLTTSRRNSVAGWMRLQRANTSTMALTSTLPPPCWTMRSARSFAPAGLARATPISTASQSGV